MAKPLPIGIQSYGDLITGGFLYVDKTKWIYEMVRYPKGGLFPVPPPPVWKKPAAIRP